jgi:hypothetical protein
LCCETGAICEAHKRGERVVSFSIFPSPKTGLVGPSDELRELLEQSGIKIVIHR